MKRSRAAILTTGFFVALLAATGPAFSLDDMSELPNPALQARYETLTKELRCLVCQNEAVADSNAFLARDLRGQVHDMLLAGKTDDQILDFMTDRYGEFVRYKPALKKSTLLIWGAPFIFLIIGAIIVFRVMRSRARLPIDDDPAGVA
jgi:cytochrome c-type biogenesis protein CcmH